MEEPRRALVAEQRRAAGRRDLLVVASAPVIAFSVGMALGLFERVHRWLEVSLPVDADAVFGATLVLVAGAATYAVARSRAARRESALRRVSERRYQAIVEHQPAITYTWDPTAGPDGAGTVYISPQVTRLLGYTPEEWLNDPDLWVRCLHPDDRDRVVAASRRSDREGIEFREEYRTATKDGEFIWVRDESVPVAHGRDGRPTLMQGVIYDVTAQKEAEAQLQEAERRYRGLVEQLPAITYSEHPTNGALLYVSPQIEDMYGYSVDEWLADPDRWKAHLHPDDRDWVLASNDADSGDTWSVDYRTITGDGRVLWVHNETSLIRDERGDPSFWQGMIFDITQRKEAEEALREAEERFRALVEHLPAVVYVNAVDDVATALYVSPQYERLTGYSAAQRVAEPDLWLRMLHPEDRDRVMAESSRVDLTGDPFDVEYRLVRADGTVVWVHDHAFMVDLPGERKAWQGVLTDVTERHAALEALGRRDQVLRAAAFAVEGFLYAGTWEAALDEVLSRLGQAVAASRAYVYRNEEGGGRLLMAQCAEWAAPGVPPTTGDQHGRAAPYDGDFRRWHDLLSAGQVVHGPGFAHPDPGDGGSVPEVRSLCVVPIRVAGGWWGFMGFDDLEEPRPWTDAEIEALRVAADTLGAAIGRQEGDRRLTETQARYRTLIEQIPAVTYMESATAAGTKLYISPQVESVFGYTPEEWNIDVWQASLHPADRDRVLAEDTRTNETGEPFDIEYRLITRDGRTVWVVDQAVLLRDADGVPLYWQGVRFDMTERKAAEQQLREAEERFRAIVEHVPSAIYLDTADETMQTVYISPQVEAITGISAAEWVADPDVWRSAVDPEDRPRVLGGYLEAIRTGEPWSDEYRMLTRDGRQIWVHDETTFLRGEDGQATFMQGVISDITQRKLAEQGLRDSEQREREAAERLRALDEMKNTFLAAVSHELRSPLTAILGLSLTLERTGDISEEDRADLQVRLSANARKLDRLLKDLLDIDRLSRGIVEPIYRITDVGALAERTLVSLDSLAGRLVESDIESVVLRVDPAKVERIIENLLANAARHTAPDRHIWLRIRSVADGGMIVVEDDGPGVPAELRTEIFEAFRQGPAASAHAPGTGIGLSLVARFAALHGGRAWVEDRAGGGASFQVFLPSVAPTDLSVNGSARTLGGVGTG